MALIHRLPKALTALHIGSFALCFYAHSIVSGENNVNANDTATVFGSFPNQNLTAEKALNRDFSTVKKKTLPFRIQIIFGTQINFQKS